MDVREGGTYSYEMINDADGTRQVTGGEYLQISPYERLVFTWGDPKDELEDCPIVTVILTPSTEGTHMTFHLAGADGAAGDDFFYDGWNSALDMLGEYLSRRRGPPECGSTSASLLLLRVPSRLLLGILRSRILRPRPLRPGSPCALPGTLPP